MDSFDDRFTERMQDVLRTAEVISVFFVRVGQSMILDFRREGVVGPAILIDDIVSSPEARLQSFRRLRPDLGLPERLMLAPWAGGVREFGINGLLDEILDRCEREGGVALRHEARRAYRRLELLERKYLRDLVQGIGMETIWQRSDP
jgi:hypothetical protein